MRDERLDLFVPTVPRWKSWLKVSVLWLYQNGLMSRKTTQRLIDRLGLRLA